MNPVLVSSSSTEHPHGRLLFASSNKKFLPLSRSNHFWVSSTRSCNLDTNRPARIEDYHACQLSGINFRSFLFEPVSTFSHFSSFPFPDTMRASQQKTNSVRILTILYDCVMHSAAVF